MRLPWIALWMIGCGSVEHAADAPSPPIDAAVDAGCVPETLLAGGMDVAAQGWQLAMLGPATLTSDADSTRLETSTMGNSGGQLLLYRPNTLTLPFAVQIVLQVERAAAHNNLDASAAIMGSFALPFGTTAERSEMIYLEGQRLGWADGQQQASIAVIDGAYHTYELAVDAAGGAKLRVDGAVALMRTGFVTNGTLAIGDQTNDPGVDSALRIRSVTKLCP